MLEIYLKSELGFLVEKEKINIGFFFVRNEILFLYGRKVYSLLKKSNVFLVREGIQKVL